MLHNTASQAAWILNLQPILLSVCKGDSDRAGGMLVSINQLSEWTRMDRRTITQRLADLHYVDGEKGAYLYEADEALPLIYNAKNPRDALDQKRGAEIDLRMECTRKERIPLKIVSAVWDAATQSFAATLKAARGKKLDVAKINELLDKLRTAKLPLTW